MRDGSWWLGRTASLSFNFETSLDSGTYGPFRQQLDGWGGWDGWGRSAGQIQDMTSRKPVFL